MKKIIAVSLLVVLLMGSIIPVSAGTGFNFISLTLNQNTYRPGDLFTFTGQLAKGSAAAVNASVAYDVVSASGAKVLVGQTLTDALGNFSIAGINRLSDNLLSGEYTLRVNSHGASYAITFPVIADETIVNINKDRFFVGEVLDVSGTVYSAGKPVANTDVAFVLYRNGQIVSEVYQIRTDSNGRFTAEYRTVEAGNFTLSVSVLGQEVIKNFLVERRNNPTPPTPPTPTPDPGQVTNPGSTPTNPPITIPGLPTQGGTVTLQDEATPLGGAVSNVTKNQTGGAAVAVTIDEKTFKASIESDDKVIQLVVKEDLPAEVTLTLPLALKKLADDAKKPIQLMTDEVNLLINADAFGEVEGDTLFIKLIKKDDMKAEKASNVYELIVEDAAGNPVALKGSLELTMAYDSAHQNHRRALGIYVYNQETEVFEYLGGTSNALMPVIKITVDTAGTYAVMMHHMDFSDLAKTHWAFDEVSTMVSRHVFKGVGDNRFEGNRAIKRSEFTAALVRAIGMKPAAGEVALTDINGAWYTEVLTTAALNGIIDAEGAFRPNDAITRAEMAALIKAAVAYFETLPEVDQAAVLAQYADHAEMSETDAENIAIATELGLFKGKNGRFEMSGDATRAEAATVIYRLLDKLSKM